ncbi:hypothetical protein HCJ33_10255 [Listeria seeligeri]|uniref:hypothetical protein n=1 Tax=Listeria seeligeri TaxID=1640 RepID=UPI001625F7C9|nr:hypothetical protein [Listeria seeligeri]MBC1990349.1 hypothetical protein [Listeria seeligeri]
MESNQSELTWQMIARAIVQNNWDFNGVSVQEMERRLDKLNQLKNRYQTIEGISRRQSIQKGIE